MSSTNSQIDPTTLGWVKNEIDEALKQARLALESFAENPTDKTRLRFCLTHLHQVTGTLLMVELDGAALIARETEALAEALVNDKAEANESGLEVLTRAILLIPDYLARLQAGQPDVPLRQLGFVNELRAAHGVEPLREVDLFAPDLSVRPPRAEGRSRMSDADFAALARDLRPRYQNALLSWLRDNAQTEALRDIVAVLGEFQDHASQVFAEQLFWVAGGLIEALAEGYLDPTPERKKFFARIDQQIKKFMDGAERSQLRKGAEELVQGMLFELGAVSGGSERVTQLRRAFGLDALFARDEGAFGMPTPEALKSVSEAMGKEIEQAQDWLATYFDPQHGNDDALDKLLEQLHRMAGILDMLGVAPLKRLVDELAVLGQALKNSQISNRDDAAMPMAQALLLIENSTRDFQHSAAGWQERIEEAIHRLRALVAPDETPRAAGIEVSDAELSETDFRELVGVVGEEINVNLGRVEEALEEYAADPGNTGRLEEIPALLNQILGALQILGQESAGGFVEETRGCVEALHRGELVADSAMLDGLAVSVGTIGAYVDGLRSGRRNLETLLDTARREMRVAMRGGNEPHVVVPAIGEDLERWLGGTEAGAVGGLIADLDVLAREARDDDQIKIDRIAEEMSRLVRLVHDGSAPLSDDIANTLRQSYEALWALAQKWPRVTAPPKPAAPRPAPAPLEPGEERSTPGARAARPPAAVTTPASAPAPAERAKVAAAQAEEADPEIIQIFIEDARDVLENTILKEYPAFRANPENNAALLEMRRGYHTIKGSGRMVGASEIAETAWAIENMLNRLRDGKIRFSPAILELLERVQAVLPVMVSELEGGPPAQADVAALRAAADAIAQGETPMAAPGAAAPAPATAPAAKAPPMAAAAPTEEDLPALDATLREIFTNEANGHLATLSEEVASCREAGACLVSDRMFRATHTLLGNARSLGLAGMAEACLEVEKLLQHCRSHQLPIGEDELALIGRMREAVTGLVEIVGRGERSSGALRGQFAKIAHAAQAAGAGAAAPAISPPAEAVPATAVAAEPRPALAPVAPGIVPPPPPPAAPRASAPAVRAVVDTPVREQVDAELLEVFQEEAVDILGAIDESLARWRSTPGELGAVPELKRSLHTLKGGARMAGAMTMGTLAHNTESLIKQVEDGKIAPGRDLLDLLDEAHDLLTSMLDALREGRPVPGAQNLNARLLATIKGEPLPAAAPAQAAVAPVPAAAAPVPMSPELAAAPAAPAEPPAPAPAAEPVAAAPAVAEAVAASDAEDRREAGETAERAWPDGMERRGQIRVNTGLLNRLVNFAGEVSIARSRMEQQIYGFRDNLSELSRNVTRFRDQIRDLEIQSESQILYRMDQEGNVPSGVGSDFDPLEFDRFSRLQQLSRQLAESLHDLSTIQGTLGNFVGEAETVLAQQARLNTDLQEGLMRTRMVAFNTQAGRLRHLVRTTARELGKRVELDLQGAEVEIDRTVLDRMVGPFEHMIRNSIDHGIEPLEQRRRAGKPADGRISIGVAQEGSEVIIRFSDDGAGLDIEAIRAKAIERGLMNKGAVLSEDELIQFILMPGFSTAARVTHLSGRGVGMDVVHSEVKQLGGAMAVDTERGRGTTFTIRLPLTLSITQALTVFLGDQPFAMPIGNVVNIVECPEEQLTELSVGTNPLFNHAERVYPFMSLAARLGLPGSPRNPRKIPVLLARAGQRDVAIQVDALGGTREIVIKPLGAQLAEVKGLGGATILGDGRVVLILDVPSLWYREDTLQVAHRPAPGRAAEKMAEAEAHRRPVVMVVDDSLTVRKITGKHLQKRGMEVLTAKDGLDAWEQLRDHRPDVMLVDIEMPRMDGYELTQRVRGDEKLKDVPIIMITSRAGAKHKQRALDLGVDIYMSKPYQEDELFANVDGLLQHGRPAQAE